MYDRRNNLSHQVEQDIRTHFGAEVFETVIPRNVRLSEAPSHGKPVILYDINSAGSVAYMDVARELLRRHGQKIPEKDKASEFKENQQERGGTTENRTRSTTMTVKQPVKKGGLGKGITSLLGGYETDVVSERRPPTPDPQQRVGASQANAARSDHKNQVLDIPVDSIVVNPHQPRRFFKDSELQSLAASIKVDGVIQPVTVTRTSTPGKYTLICRERRLRASRLAGLDKVPAIIRDPMSDQEQLRVALIENIQRQDLNIVEEAEAYHSLIQDFWADPRVNVLIK